MQKRYRRLSWLDLVHGVYGMDLHLPVQQVAYLLDSQVLLA